MTNMTAPGPNDEPVVEFCSDCGWAHSNVPNCWRAMRRRALEKLADPSFAGPMRERLQDALDKFEQDRLETVAFLSAAAYMPDEDEGEL